MWRTWCVLGGNAVQLCDLHKVLDLPKVSSLYHPPHSCYGATILIIISTSLLLIFLLQSLYSCVRCTVYINCSEICASIIMQKGETI